MPKNKFPFGEKNVRDLYLLGANDEYKEDIKKLYKKYSISSECEEISGKESLEILEDPKSMEFFKETIELMQKYNISNTFGLLIALLSKKGYLAKVAKGKKINVDVEEITNFLLSSSGIKMTDKGKAYFSLNIYSDTTIKDIQKQWPMIKSMLGKKKRRSKQSKNLKRDLEILRLKNAGKKANEISKIINNDFRFSKQKITYQEVSRIIKRLKEKARKNMPDKDS